MNKRCGFVTRVVFSITGGSYTVVSHVTGSYAAMVSNDVGGYAVVGSITGSCVVVNSDVRIKKP